MVGDMGTGSKSGGRGGGGRGEFIAVVDASASAAFGGLCRVPFVP